MAAVRTHLPCDSDNVISRAEGDAVLIDRADLAAILRLSPATIRAHCRPTAYDPDTGRALYDYDTCTTQLAGVKARGSCGRSASIAP